ncbi:hypothetical protein AB0L05_16095 [Nonomuraea pusilla]|uniref:hypothetical protein n=1 Tax=Nonomuraea pusilla TaxID=46177 RepID=UPI00332F6EF2
MTDYDYGALWFTLLMVAIIVWRIYTRLRFPKSACRCSGGRIYSSSAPRWRDCSRCCGTGIRDRRK